MLAVYSEDNVLHEPEGGSAERAKQLLAALQEGRHEIIAPRDHGIEPLAAVHDLGYLTFLESAYEQWQQRSPAGPMAVANCYAMRHMSTLPHSFDGQLGYYLSGNSVPVGPQTWRSIRSSADCAIEAADAVANGVAEAYALCQPPGHHAYADLAGGSCYLNNAAVAAERLRRRFGLVSVLDVDVHHGNGTQGIFWERADVQFVSIHADPNDAYPFYAGYEDEQGAGAGFGTTLNLPLPVGTEDAGFLEALRMALAEMQRFRPDALVLSLGLASFRADPAGLMRISTEGFGAIGRLIGATQLPTVIIQEGGRAVDALRKNLGSFLAGFLSDRAA